MGRAEYERQAGDVVDPAADASAAGQAGTPGSTAPSSEPRPEAEQAPDEVVQAEVVEAGVVQDEQAENEAARGDGTEQDAQELSSALAEAEQRAEEYLDFLRRERAEFENFRKRTTKERMEALDRGAESLIASMLGVLDNFGFVLQAADKSPDEQLAKGAEMVHTELMKVLKQAGLEEVPGAGEPFDPTYHEAMMQVEAEEPVDAPTVAEVLRPGYRFKGRVLRPASVSVAQ